MAFSLKTWVNRISEYPNRRKLTHEDGSTELVTVARAEGQISAEGNAFSAEEMNDLENRIKGGFDEVNQSLTQLNEGIFKEPIQINYIYNYTSAMQKVLEYECEETGIYVINVSGDDFFTHCFITDERYAAQIAAMSNNGVATKIQCTNQYKMYKGHKYKIELWNATFQMYKY
jgi:hypothetical protein